MSDKSHVSMEQHVCLVCGHPFDTGSLLLDRRFRATMVLRTTTCWGLCPEHQALFDDGYVALVECDPERSGIVSGGETVQPDEAYRTGPVAHFKREAFARVFNVALGDRQPCVFVEPGVIARLRALTEESSG